MTSCSFGTRFVVAKYMINLFKTAASKDKSPFCILVDLINLPI